MSRRGYGQEEALYRRREDLHIVGSSERRATEFVAKVIKGVDRNAK
jgi:hypothetical protein